MVKKMWGNDEQDSIRHDDEERRRSYTNEDKTHINKKGKIHSNHRHTRSRSREDDHSRRRRTRSQSPKEKHRDDQIRERGHERRYKEDDKNDAHRNDTIKSNDRSFSTRKAYGKNGNDHEDPQSRHRQKKSFLDKRKEQQENEQKFGLKEEWGKPSDKKETSEKKEDSNVPKKKPDLGLSGVLAAEQNTFNGVVLKYSEPPEARKYPRNSRLYIFKGKEQIDLLHVHRQSAYLIGRDRNVADIPIDHPSCSKQHAVLQYRQTTFRNDVGELQKEIKPYIIDLESTNGTFLNTVRIDPSKYYEIKEGDVIKFGESTRDYVFLTEDVI